jgi:lycopene cyclase domain-containing protein
LNPKYLYLFVDILSLIFPFLFSFHSKANFSKQWKFVLPGIAITGIIFLVWDEIFTRMGIWGFNEKYTTRIYLMNLPLEEVLFFICIPYACCFTYFAIDFLIEKDLFAVYARGITLSLILLSLVAAVMYWDRWYTVVTFSALAVLLSYHLFANTKTLGRFYLAFIILLTPFFIVNGILTGTGLNEAVVWYNRDEIIGVKLGSIPIEDCFYAMLMILLSLTIAEKMKPDTKKIAHLAEGYMYSVKKS